MTKHNEHWHKTIEPGTRAYYQGMPVILDFNAVEGSVWALVSDRKRSVALTWSKASELIYTD